MRIKDKVALVTGGASGIGAAICKRFSDEGAYVVIADINRADGELLSQKLGERTLYIELDVRAPDQWRSAIEKTVAQLGGLDILINNAGIVIPGDIESCSHTDWQLTQSVNSDGVFFGCQEGIKTMKHLGGGSIINISSIEGIIGEPLAAAYNASKGAVRILTKSAALHCADHGYHIRVNSLHPGYVATPLVSGAVTSLSENEMREFQQRIIGNIPMKRIAKPEEIASAALFLASDDASYMTGAELVVDGGYTAH